MNILAKIWTLLDYVQERIINATISKYNDFAKSLYFRE